MGFAASGVYTAPSGATSAASGDVIRSATWNTIFSDLSSALTSICQGGQALIVCQLTGYAYASLPSASAGMVVYLTDSNDTAWGATVTAGGGSTPVLIWNNGSEWHVLAS